ncbi:Eco57I restriction-modification methylase domain-containing protein [Cyanobacterium sp. DS4]|uniref:Eco57I restriction-modification methylase domain-containing protein n=1 Tax=Cyanobacterium sp. DS4 TaxID=2878255 RepID=UPI002E80B540|nr:Eco57I restriction-modification methylase domain-containing protein [Cyanobacterium sp. Dongsha4]WVL00418.1 Eco57I restriction-modification methylase domain-containing protein [Cyanobacterium sp. Dongsha4]
MPKNNIDLKSNILDSLSLFSAKDTVDAIAPFYQTLGYSTELNVELDNASPTDFLMMINQDKIDSKRLLLDEWQSVDYLFQLTEEQIKQISDIPQFNIDYINSYLFLTITLKKDYYSRTQLSSITREINKLSAIPIMLTFRHGNSLTLAIIDRRPNQKDNDKDVLQKITLIKDINFVSPHRAHLEILNDFALSTIIKNNKPENFDDLHLAWRKVLDTSALNKQFYREIANWYFWAVKTVNFPSIIEDKTVNNATNIIRLITRLIFVWFLKEKGLIPNTLFNVNSVTKIVRPLEDKESTYYKAILQNLFFATLNTEIKPDNRQFNDSPNSYRYQDYFEDTKQFLELTTNIPFLNGGLFECLDKEMLIDGFSEAVDNPLTVPNKLFFGGEESIDLSKVYGSKKRNREKVRGIINIFNDYKFTIDENTPIDEEIALDPELLGKVFENLLAEYNPETETTARKQTGSFYTPREIVNYMVDESIIAYLKQQLLNDSSGYVELGSNQTNLFGNEHNQQQTLQTKVEDNPFIGKEDELESSLRELLSFSEINPFTPDISQKLITAIDSLKILDPACGSGAFPMGILQKLVHILSKLDPHNEQWRNQQKERAIAPVQKDIKTAQNIGDEEARSLAIEKLKTRLQQIEDEFNNNEQDYPRKLFLIENCIYGVDIQPIAVQISKLRFFISLIVEQKVNDNLENRGILPLPNLETKFVSANTLIGVDNQKTLRTNEVEKKEAELKKVRHNYFSANNPQDKQRCKQQDQQLRTEITTLLKETGLTGAIADTLARWNPYDQNVSSDFFDSEWMFGVTGFDIVIGNPPYVRQEAIKYLKPILQKQYNCYTGVADLYVYFYEQGLKLLRNNGYLTYITPNKYFRAGYGQKLRQYLTQNSQIEILIDFGDANVFEATTYPSIILFKKQNNSDNQDIKVLNWDENNSLNDFKVVYEKDKFLVPQKSLTADGWRLESSQILNLLDKLKSTGIPLGEYVNGRFYYGIKTGFNEAFIVDRETRDKLINEHPSSAEVLKPLIRGRDVKRWIINFAEQYLIKIESSENKKHPWSDKPEKEAEKIFGQTYPAIYKRFHQYRYNLIRRNNKGKYFWELHSCTYWDKYNLPKILYQEIATYQAFAWDDNNYISNNKTFFIYDSNLYLLGLLNSRIVWFFLHYTASKLQGGAYAMQTPYISQIPIPKGTEEQKREIETLVHKCLENKGVNVQKYEEKIDEIISKLYALTIKEIMIVHSPF